MADACFVMNINAIHVLPHAYICNSCIYAHMYCLAYTYASWYIEEVDLGWNIVTQWKYLLLLHDTCPSVLVALCIDIFLFFYIYVYSALMLLSCLMSSNEQRLLLSITYVLTNNPDAGAFFFLFSTSSWTKNHWLNNFFFIRWLSGYFS